MPPRSRFTTVLSALLIAVAACTNSGSSVLVAVFLANRPWLCPVVAVHVLKPEGKTSVGVDAELWMLSVWMLSCLQ